MNTLSAIIVLALLAINPNTKDVGLRQTPMFPIELKLPLANLVAWYELDGTADDAIEPKADGRMVNGKWSDGLVLNGNGQVDVGKAPKLDFRSGFTLMARIKTKEAAFGQVVGSNGAGGLVVCINQIKLASWGADWIAETFIPEDEWVHVAVALDDQGRGRMYLNGAEIASSRVQPFPQDPDNWTIGGWAVGEGFKGSLGDVMIWNKALAGDEIKQIATFLGLGNTIAMPKDEPAPISETPKSVQRMAEVLRPLAVEPDLLPRYPFAAMMGGQRFDQALRARTHAMRAGEEKWLADEIPTFDCPDQKWMRCWYYRWFVVRANYAEEDGVPGFFEGKRGGYTRHITYSAPHIMDEVRWLSDGRYAFGQAEILGKRREPDGRRFGGYTHWIAATLWDAYLVHPDKKELARLLPAWAEDTECAFPGKLDTNRPLRDYLLNPPSHWATGMEWQPGWFYFDNYDRGKETNLYRPDYTAYYYANARAVASAYRELGQPEKAAQFDALADKIKQAMNELMWDSQTGYFYSVKAGTDQKAMVKEIVGIYPFAFGAADKGKVRAFDSILDPEEFWGPWKVTTCTMKCPMYTPKVRLCNWNGPVWPHAESLVANALAQGIRTYMSPKVTPEKLWEFMDSYTSLHFEDKGTWRQPNIHEEGNADDGMMYGCPDYFHSTYNDLVITLVGGLVPRADDVIELYPVVGVPWDHFRLDRIPYKGHLLSIVWDDRPSGRYEGVPRGFSLYVDGKRLKTMPKLQRVMVKMV